VVGFEMRKGSAGQGRGIFGRRGHRGSKGERLGVAARPCLAKIERKSWGSQTSKRTSRAFRRSGRQFKTPGKIPAERSIPLKIRGKALREDRKGPGLRPPKTGNLKNPSVESSPLIPGPPGETSYSAAIPSVRLGTRGKKKNSKGAVRK